MRTLHSIYIAQEWEKIAPWHMPNQTISADRIYALPDEKWLLKCAELYGFESGNWMPSFDCDDFAFGFKLKMQMMHKESKSGVDGFLIGVVFYIDDNGGGHAINWSMDRKNKVYFIDVKKKEKKVCLSERELHSVSFVYY